MKPFSSGGWTFGIAPARLSALAAPPAADGGDQLMQVLVTLHNRALFARHVCPSICCTLNDVLMCCREIGAEMWGSAFETFGGLLCYQGSMTYDPASIRSIASYKVTPSQSIEFSRTADVLCLYRVNDRMNSPSVRGTSGHCGPILH